MINSEMTINRRKQVRLLINVIKITNIAKSIYLTADIKEENND